MKRIQLWSVERLESGSSRALSLDEVASTETEHHLEELLVASPNLLMEGLRVVARQLPTDAGFPDLLGIDQDGQLVVLELKRGTLTRDAVAQVLDYGSDLRERAPEDLARLIEQHSGQGGVEEIEDFIDWHGREYPDAEVLQQTPRMVLVGLGVDERAKRIVNFLAESGVDIQLLTFHAFNLNGKLLLAKQVETVSPSVSRSEARGTSKQANLANLLALAEQHRVSDLLREVADFIDKRLPCYRWPGKTAYSFSLQERTETGSPTLRSYLTLYVDYWQKRGALVLTLSSRAQEAAAEAMTRFLESLPEGARRESPAGYAIPVEITKQSWVRMQDSLGALLQALVEGWKRKSAAEEAEELREGQEAQVRETD